MRINLDSITSRKACTVTLDMTSYTLRDGSCDISNIEPVSFEVTKTGKDEYSVVGSLSMTLLIPCDRCLTPTDVSVSFDFDYVVDVSKDSDCEYLDGKELLVEELLYPDMLMNMPVKVLCRQDCRGLCHVCGSNLNNGDCGCDRDVLDPRMAVISDIFKKFDK